MNKDVIIALDFQSKEEVVAFLSQFPEPVYTKVGMELFYKEGPEIVKYLKQEGHKVFLDLKFHDIPNTVAGAVRSVASLDVDMMNVQAAGGVKMMEAGMEELKKQGKDALLISITMLTSTSGEILKNELLIDRPLDDTVLHYASNTKKAGLHGVVCSALEVPLIKSHLGAAFVTVTPGIRPKDAAIGDQVRVVTPAEARALGSDYIVVGRPITKAADPYAVYRAIRNDFLGLED
ncbi:orotidine-5'-phosphate decarboxylase [Clostridiaceae bacterium HFYG-1003]|nr:orotidine-5'-phosphate decarboxylase [Clostridiaceae bacterium HFYG-1003]